MPDAAADEALDPRHPYGRIAPGWCEDCGEHACRCRSARDLSPLAVPALDGRSPAP